MYSLCSQLLISQGGLRIPKPNEGALAESSEEEEGGEDNDVENNSHVGSSETKDTQAKSELQIT